MSEFVVGGCIVVTRRMTAAAERAVRGSTRDEPCWIAHRPRCRTGHRTSVHPAGSIQGVGRGPSLSRCAGGNTRPPDVSLTVPRYYVAQRVTAPVIFIGGYRGLEDQSPPVGSRSEAPMEDLRTKQFADIIYRFWLHKRSQFRNFAQFTSWFLTSMFHGGAKRYFRGRETKGISPLGSGPCLAQPKNWTSDITCCWNAHRCMCSTDGYSGEL